MPDQAFNREIRSPAVGAKLNRILSGFPDISANEALEIFRPICLRAEIVRGKKSHKRFRDRIQQMEYWADGFFQGGHQDVAIVSAVLRNDPPYVVVFIVRDYKQFCSDLEDAVSPVIVHHS